MADIIFAISFCVTVLVIVVQTAWVLRQNGKTEMTVYEFYILIVTSLTLGLALSAIPN